MDALVGNIVATLSGTVIGYALNELSTWRREKKSAKEQAKSVRTLLSIEIDQNLELANEFWSKIKNLNDERFHDEPELCCRMIGLPLPKFSEKVFDSQLPLLTSALNPNEIKQTYQLYNNLNRILPIYTKLDLLYKSYEASYNPNGILPRHEDLRFTENAPQIWDEVESLFASFLGTGNPLQSKSKK